MKIKIIELKTDEDFRIHGPFSRSPGAVLQRKLGNKLTHTYRGDRCGTVRTQDGKNYDWFISDNTGDVVIVPAT